MNVLIIEDEQIAADKLQRQLKKIDVSISVLAVIDSVKQAKQWLAENTCDLIFLDIHLADGLSFEIFETEKITSPIIFTTAYDEYALKAFKLNSIDYLLKPINVRDLERALDKYQHLNISAQPTPDYTQLLQMFSKDTAYKQAFLITYNEQISRLAVSSIAYFFAESKHVLISEHSGKQHIIDISLDKIQTQLDPQIFFRVNRKYLVNREAIAEMHTWTKSRLKLILTPVTSDEVIISNERVRQFKEWMMH